MKIAMTSSLVLIFIGLLNAQWQVLNSPTQNTLWSVCFTDTSNGWAVGENGTIIHTTDAGITWDFQTSGTNNILLSVFFTDGINGWTVGQNGTILHTSNSGINWNNQSGITSCLKSVYFVNLNIGWAVGCWVILHTTNGGVNWIEQSVNPFQNTLYGVFFIDEFNGWAVGGTNNHQFIIHSTNGGSDWFVQSNETGSWLYSVSFADELNGWVSGENGTILHTIDGGNTWLNQNSGVVGFLESIFFTDNNNGWIAGQGSSGIILHTTDAGNTWTEQISNTNLGLYSIFFTDPYHGWAVGYGGVIIRTPYVIPVELISFTVAQAENQVFIQWRTATETNNRGFEIQRKLNKSDWEIIGFLEGHGTTTESQEYSYTDDIRAVDEKLITYRLKQIDFDGSSSYSEEVVIENKLSLDFALYQNYPNPFNPSTKIKFTIPSVIASGLPAGEAGTKQSQLVTLKVYDILGNEIATLVNEEKPAGTYEIEFSAKGGSASGGNSPMLPSGIYFYQLKVFDPSTSSPKGQVGQGIVQTRKMLLLK